MKKYIEQLRKDARGVVNKTAHFLELAENYMAEENIEAAKACLFLLCEHCDNYEESIEWNGLTDKWQKYRYLVADLIPPSVKISATPPCLPAECTMQIKNILTLSDDSILSELSKHLGELSGNGGELNRLNKYERVVFLVDELWAEVNSGGFDSYLYYNGTHFEKAHDALECISAFGVLSILDNVRSKFPKSRIPQKEEALQNAMDALEKKGIDFEAEDESFYSIGEKELLVCLLKYVRENENRFR